MDPNFEQDIPMPLVIAVFITLMILSTILRNKLREKKLVNLGQITTKDGRIPSIQERVAKNKEWSKGEIVSKGRNLMLAIWLGAIVMNLTLGLTFIKSLSNPEIKTPALIMMGVFASFGVGFAIFAIRLTIKYLRYGESRCRITDKAGVLGSTMTGVIQTKNEIKAKGDFTIRLQCLEFYTVGSGNNRRSESKIHWQTKQQVNHSSKSTKMGIPFSFDLPKFPPETGYQLARGDISWQISIDAPLEGVDYSAVFPVPVFKMDYTE